MMGNPSPLRRGIAVLAVVAGLAACGDVRGPEDVRLWGGTIAPSALPAPVTNSITAKFPGASIYEAERERLGSRVWYDVKFRTAEGRYEAKVYENGVIDGVSRLGQ